MFCINPKNQLQSRLSEYMVHFLYVVVKLSSTTKENTQNFTVPPAGLNMEPYAG